MAARNIAGVNQQAANQAGALRAQEMLSARDVLGQSLTQFRGQDLDRDLKSRQLNQQAATDAQTLQGRMLETRLGQQGTGGPLMALGASLTGGALGSMQSNKANKKMAGEE
jgi:uncharacterized protein with von Willebrand factor type A (vWA) domain